MHPVTQVHEEKPFSLHRLPDSYLWPRHLLGSSRLAGAISRPHIWEAGQFQSWHGRESLVSRSVPLRGFPCADLSFLKSVRFPGEAVDCFDGLNVT